MHSPFAEHRKDRAYWTAVGARTFALILLFSQARLYLAELVPPSFLLAAMLLSCAAAFVAERLCLRLPVALLAGIALAALIRFGFVLAFGIDAVLRPGPETDGKLFLFDQAFIPVLLPAGWLFFSTFLCLRYRKVLAGEPLVNVFLLAVVFWSQAGYRGKLYGHPAVFALVVSCFFALELASLFATALAGRDNRPAGWLRRTGTAVLGAVPLLAILFVLVFSRYSEGAIAQGGGLIKPTLLKFDFSQYLTLESEISLGKDLVLIMKKKGADESILLRRYVLAGYTPRRGFFSDPERQGDAGPLVLPDRTTLLADPGYRGRTRVEQEYYIVNFDSSSFIAMNYPVSVTPFAPGPSTSFSSSYSVVSKVPDLYPFDLVEADAPVPGTTMDRRAFAYYTNYGNDEQIRRFAEEVTKGITGYYDRIMAVYSCLHDGYYYSLKPGLASDGNQIHHFLFTSKKGYCSYFAFSMALMLRSLGIPARVSVGFFINPQVQAFGYYPVRSDMAHAWVEVFYPGYGWIDYDPTSTTVAPGENLQLSQGMDTEQFSRLLKEILAGRDDRRIRRGPTTGARDGTAGRAAFIRLLGQFWYLALIALWTVVAVMIRFAPLLTLPVARDAPRRVKMRYRYLLTVIASAGYRKDRNESTLEFARRLEGEAGIILVGTTCSFLRASFAPVFAEDDEASFRVALSRSLASYRAAVPAGRRMLAFMLPGVGGTRLPPQGRQP